MRAWIIGLGVMMYLGGSLHAYALDGYRRITQYARTHFAARVAARDGMPHSMAAAITQTPNGYLWDSRARPRRIIDIAAARSLHSLARHIERRRRTAVNSRPALAPIATTAFIACVRRPVRPSVSPRIPRARR